MGRRVRLARQDRETTTRNRGKEDRRIARMTTPWSGFSFQLCQGAIGLTDDRRVRNANSCVLSDLMLCRRCSF